MKFTVEVELRNVKELTIYADSEHEAFDKAASIVEGWDVDEYDILEILEK